MRFSKGSVVILDGVLADQFESNANSGFQIKFVALGHSHISNNCTTFEIFLYPIDGFRRSGEHFHSAQGVKVIGNPLI